jgi:hypothetical protein
MNDSDFVTVVKAAIFTTLEVSLFFFSDLLVAYNEWVV